MRPASVAAIVALLALLPAHAPHAAAPGQGGCIEQPGNAFLRPCQAWTRGIEGQRRADLGDGTYLNPIVAGDHPDPSILKVGRDYYMVFSTFESYPGLTVWRSRDLVNWQPIGPALHDYVGSVWAPELVRHGKRFYIYLPARKPGRQSIYVVHADDIRGPWSKPIDLDPDDRYPDRIDPGHVVGEDGRRYLFLSGGDYVQLADDGLGLEGELKHAYDGWRYPAEWDVESYSQEGPKMLRHGGYFHMVTAVGGTAGPPTGHMVISARARSVHGPWENSPHNPIVRTASPAEKWWSRGHATLVEGPTTDDWYMVYHGYENGFHTLGRQALLEPIAWTDDGWFRSAGRDVGRPIPKPRGGTLGAHGMPLSDDFGKNRFGETWSFFRGDTSEQARLRYARDAGGPYLELRGKGDSPSNATPMTFVAGDQAYQFEVDIEPGPGAQAGALLFYNDKLYAGVGLAGDEFILHRYGMDQRRTPRPSAKVLRLRITNNRHVVSAHYSIDAGRTWTKYDTQWEVSGYHHNVAGGFMALRPALYAAGTGSTRFRNLVYRALP